jgi:hypothetical protein
MEKIILYSLKTVRPKGKSKLPKLWKEARKQAKKLFIKIKNLGYYVK